MTASSGAPLVLIVDHDVAFIMWLGEVFTELGFQAVPALHSRQALSLVKRLDLPITILIVNPDLPGAAWMVNTLMASHPITRVVSIKDFGVPPVPGEIQPNYTLERPSPWETISRSEWLAKVRKILM